MVRTLLAAATLALAATPARAHPAPFSYVDVRLDPGDLRVSAVMHDFDVGHELGVDAVTLLDPAVAAAHGDRIRALVASRVAVVLDGRRLEFAWSGPDVLADRDAIRVAGRASLSRPPAELTIGGLLFPYDPIHQTFVNVYEGGALSQAIVDARHPRFTYAARTVAGPLPAMRRFVPAGIRHILSGADHLLFLVGLLLVGGSLRQLALVVTAFTVAHSLTLALAALGMFAPSARVIEPAIALSIVFVGADNLLGREGRDVRAGIAFAFGLVHGFGFAGVLREMALPSGALGWALFSFNIGVEIGQLAVVIVAASALAWLARRHAGAGRLVAAAGSIAVMAAGTYWFVERVFFAGGLS